MLLLSGFAIKFAADLRLDGLRELIRQPFSLRLDAIRGMRRREGLAIASMLALTVVLIAASAVNLSASADTYRKSFVAERYTNARENLVKGDYEHALQHLEAVRRVSPPNPQLDQAIDVMQSRYALLSQQYDEGKRLYDEGRWQPAIGYFDRILQLEPRFKDVERLREKAASQMENQQPGE